MIEIEDLERALQAVRRVWKDDVAKSYDYMNYRIAEYVHVIEETHLKIDESKKLLDENYSEKSWDNIIYSLGNEVSKL